jgi:hypothetical protein
MTLLAAWVGVDSKKDGPKACSFYIATDSRITWAKGTTYDLGTKVFGMKKHPEIFGFCGDVLFPTSILKQLVDQGDAGILFPDDISAGGKFAIVKQKIAAAIHSYPKAQTTGSFVIIYGTRDQAQDFHCYRLSWNNREGFSKENEKIVLPNFSSVIAAEGSGGPEFLERFNYHYDLSRHNDYRTSRSVYHCFTETLDQIENHACGGAPQIVGLYRIANSRFFGIIKDRKRFFMGQEVSYSENLKFVEWRNDLFERCDPENIQILDAAQRQPRT